MPRLLLLCLFASLLSADDHWIKFASGPFEVFTDAGSRPGRETLLRFEEFRHAVGSVTGVQDMTAPQPIRIMVFKNTKGWAQPAPLVEGRDRYDIVLAEKADVSPDVYRALTRLLLDANTGRMPGAFEHGLMEFFSTFAVSGIHITAGAPPPKTDLDWARVHLLIVDPDYYGKLRVLLYNLRNGAPDDVAYGNAFGKTPAQVEAQAKAHLAAGNFQTTSLSSRPLAAADFEERPVSDADARLARADLLAGEASAGEYQALLRGKLKTAEAEEGLGLLALRGGRKDEALQRFTAAMNAGSASPRCYIEYARLEPDNEKAEKALLKAAGINPKLDEPFALLAQRDTDPRARLAHWKAAAERNPRNAEYWKNLAECYLADHNYGDAAKAWTAGEQAATEPAERQRMREARQAIERQRLDYQAAEKKRQAEEDARELERLKAEARAEVHALESKYNDPAPKTDQKPVPWWDGPQPSGHARGALKQVDCIGKQARLVIETDDRKTVRLLVADPSKVAINGAGDLALGCGAQKARRVRVEYFPKTNARLGTAGEVATIEFQ
ncbi:MAG: hypothetical protein LAQ30_00765 [Acidobacteriia bacterium]|nr:hypothetical protein [Terriglobia bacterium]